MIADEVGYRGSVVWIGAGSFGADVVSRLAKTSVSSDSPELRESTKFFVLGGAGGPEVERLELVGEIGDRLRDAVGELLEGEHSRRLSQRGVFLEPDVWLVVDIGLPGCDQIWSEVAEGIRKLHAEKVYVRPFLLLRHLSWLEQDAEGSGRSPATFVNWLTRTAIDSDRPELAPTVAFVVSDFDEKNTRYPPHQCTEVASIFAEFVHLTDITRRSLQDGRLGDPLETRLFPHLLEDQPLERRESEDVFQPTWSVPSGHGGKSVPTLLAGIGGQLVRVPMERIHGDRVTLRNTRLSQAMLERPLASWFPRSVPEMAHAEVESEKEWSTLRLPVWKISMWSDGESGAEDALGTWIAWVHDAEKWRRVELVTAVRLRLGVRRRADRIIGQYLETLDEGIDSTLRQRDTVGFVAPIEEYLLRCQAELEVRRAEQRLGAADLPEDISDEEMLRQVSEPAGDLAEVTGRINRVFRVRLNPIAVVLSAVITGLLAWYWLVRSVEFAWDSSVGFIVRSLQIERFPDINETATEWSDRLSTWKAPEMGQLVAWSGVAVVTYVGFTLFLILMRERGRLERAVDGVRRQAAQWRDESQSTLRQAVRQTSRSLDVKNLLAGLQMIEDRMQRNADFEMNARADGERAGLELSVVEPGRVLRGDSPFEVEITPEVLVADLSESEAQACLAAYFESRKAVGWFEGGPEEFRMQLAGFAATWCADSIPTLENQPFEVIQSVRERLKTQTSRPLVRPVNEIESKEGWLDVRLLGVPEAAVKVVSRGVEHFPICPVSSKETIYDVSVLTRLRPSDLLWRDTAETGDSGSTHQQATESES